MKSFFRCLLVRPILVPVAIEKQFGKLTKIVANFPMMILEYFFLNFTSGNLVITLFVIPPIKLN